MFAYCVEGMYLSEPETATAHRGRPGLARHPSLLDMLRDGRLHLSGIALLAPHLTEQNRDAVLSRATHLSKRRIEELVAELAPRPDAPALGEEGAAPAAPRRPSIVRTMLGRSRPLGRRRRSRSPEPRRAPRR